MKKVDIGLDIGIASVGWAITDIETLDIEEYGVRLFPSVDHPKDSKLKNEERREKRSSRRQVNRRRTLKRDFVKFLIDQKYIDDIKFNSKSQFVSEFLDKYINNSSLQKKWKSESKEIPYILKIRKEALNHKVSKNKFIAILYWYINHRGFKYKNVEEDDKKKKNQKIKIPFEEKNSQKLPVENQIQYFKNHGYLNGTFNRTFHQDEYKNEIAKIFSNQNTNEKFKEGFIELFTRQRSFEEGPGDAASKTKYGRYYNLERVYNSKNQLSYELKKVDEDNVPNSIWENTIGKCTFYPNEQRAPKKSFTSEVFNLLNELNNIHNEKTGEIVDKEQKLKIIKIALEKGGTSNKMLKNIYKYFELDSDDQDVIKGFPINKSGKKFLTEIISLKQLKKVLPSKFTSFEYLFEDLKINKENIIDKIISIFSKSKTIEKREELLCKDPKDSIWKEIKDKEMITTIANAKVDKVFKTHSLSFKVMREMIPDLIVEPRMNQSVWAKNKGIDFNENKNYGTKYLDSEWIEDVIITPSVKRSFRQTAKVLNAIFKLTNDRKLKIRSIIIEMARETKNDDAKKQETNRQKYFENKNIQIKSLIKDISKKPFNDLSNHTLEKIWLLDQQKGHDAYTGDKICMKEVIEKPGNFDIDHIIPYSQSYSNNRSNKVLTRQQVNQKKSNLTSFQFLSKQDTFNKMKTFWQNWYLGQEKEKKVYRDYDKYNFLTTETDFSKSQNQLGFIQRNLVDTRYTTKAIMEALKEFSKNDKNNFNFKVKAINGKMTAFARNKISTKYANGKEIERLHRPYNLPLFDEKEIKIGDETKIIKSKSRIWNGHHAEDAYIVTILNSHYHDSKAIEIALSSPWRLSRLKRNKNNPNEEKGEWFEKEFSDLMNKFEIARKKLNYKMSDIRFSRMIEKNKNTKLFNETLYKGKINSYGLVDKYVYKEILSKDFKAQDYFGKDSKHKDELMIYKYDKDLYNELNKIYLNYYSDGKTNPFLEATNDVDKKYIEVSYKVKNQKITKKIKRLNLLSQEGTKAKNPLKIIKANNNGNSFYESLEWVAINMYKDKKGNYKIIPINASNHRFKTLENDKVQWIVKEDILDKQLKEKNIENNKPIATFLKGDVLILPNNEGLVYICGHNENADKLETKFLFKQKINSDKDRDYRTLNTKLIGSKLVKLDVLGIKIKQKFIF